jgi:nitrogen fixation NifU-like protein
MDKRLLDEVIAHYKHPWHRGCGAGQRLHAENLSCGDVLDLYVEVVDGKVRAASWEGELCSIATYGADLLAERIVGMAVEDVGGVTSEELLGVKGEATEGGGITGRVNGARARAAGAELLRNPVRLKCFKLAQVAARGLN